MKTIVCSIVPLLVLSLSFNKAYGCRYLVNLTDKPNELRQVALDGIVADSFLYSYSQNFSYYESIPTETCPDEVTYKATVSVKYTQREKVCVADFAVKKRERWDDSKKNTYTVVQKKKICKVMEEIIK